MPHHRVVVTGLGAITPIGHDIESFWSAACRGVSGTRRLVGIDEDRLNARVAAQVLDFDTDAVLRRKDRRHLPRAAPLGIAAASQALENAGLLEDGAYAGPPEDASVVIGSGGGGKAEPELDRLSNILKAFNEQFGNIAWSDVDRVHKLITEDIPARVAADTAYQNAMKQRDKQNARIEHDKALKRVMTNVLKDDTELFKQFMDNEGFRRWMTDTVFGLTYDQPNVP